MGCSPIFWVVSPFDTRSTPEVLKFFHRSIHSNQNQTKLFCHLQSKKILEGSFVVFKMEGVQHSCYSFLHLLNVLELATSELLLL